MKNQKSFTLLELIIVIIIIGVLTSLALPRLLNAVEFSKRAEALAIFGTIRRQFEMCVLMNDDYYNACLMGTMPGFWSRIGMENPSDVPGSSFAYGLYGISFSLPSSPGGFMVKAYTKTESGVDYSSYVGAWFCEDNPHIVCGGGVFESLGECGSFPCRD